MYGGSYVHVDISADFSPLGKWLTTTLVFREWILYA